MSIYQKGIVQIFTLFILIAGLLAGLYLIQRTTNILPKAFSSPTPSPSTIFVDVIIHKGLSNQQAAEEWAQDIVNNYVNERFNRAGITKQLQVDRVIKNYDEKSGCSVPGATPIYDRCEFKDGKIHVWIYREGFRYGSIFIATSVDPSGAQVFMEVPQEVTVETPNFYGWKPLGNILTHELGHIFTLPDYYFEDVPPSFNEVVPIGIIAYVKDIMWNQNIYDFFSETSKNYINRVTLIPAGFDPPYIPAQTKVKITDESGQFLSGVKVEVFKQKSDVKFERVIGTIPNTASFEGLTDENGEFILGDSDRIFNPPHRFDSANSVFLRFTRDEEVRYGAITRSYLNSLYFEGQEDIATITVPFSSLVEYRQGQIVYLSHLGQPAPDEIFTDFSSPSEKDNEVLEEHIFDELQVDQREKDQ